MLLRREKEPRRALTPSLERGRNLIKVASTKKLPIDFFRPAPAHSFEFTFMNPLKNPPCLPHNPQSPKMLKKVSYDMRRRNAQQQQHLTSASTQCL